MCVVPSFFFIPFIYLFIYFAHFEGKIKLKSRCLGGKHEAEGAPETGKHTRAEITLNRDFIFSSVLLLL